MVYPFLTEEFILPSALRKYVPSIDERMSMWNGAVDELRPEDRLLVVRYNPKHGKGASVPLVDALVEHARGRLGERVVVYKDLGDVNGPLLYDYIGCGLRKSLGHEVAHGIERIRGYGELGEVFYMTHHVAICLGIYWQAIAGIYLLGRLNEPQTVEIMRKVIQAKPVLASAVQQELQKYVGAA